MMSNLNIEKEKVQQAESLYITNYSDDQRFVLDKINKKLLNYGKLQLLEFGKIKFKAFLLLLLFQAFAMKNISVPKYEIRPQGRATWIGVNNQKIFDTLLGLGFPMKLI